MKIVWEIEAVYHCIPQRIIAHVHFYVLAYLLMRVVESRSEERWEFGTGAGGADLALAD